MTPSAHPNRRATADRLEGAASSLDYLQSYFSTNDRSPALRFIAETLKDQARLLRAASGAVFDRQKAEDAAYSAITLSLEGLDAALIAEHSRFDGLEHQFQELFDDLERIEDNEAREAATDTIRRRQKPILNRMAKRRAQTWAGIAARYRTLMQYDAELTPEKRASDPSEYESRRLLAMLLRDLGDVLTVGGLLDEPEGA